MTEKICPDWKQRVVFSREGPRPEVLFETPEFKVVLAGLEPGQRIPAHPEGAGVFYILEGTGWMQVGEERFVVQPGATVVSPAGVSRGVEAETRLAFIATRIAQAR